MEAAKSLGHSNSSGKNVYIGDGMYLEDDGTFLDADGCILDRLDVMPLTIISGGQTGADRAGLDWAISRGVPHAGWCLKGRIALDGQLDLATTSRRRLPRPTRSGPSGT